MLDRKRFGVGALTLALLFAQSPATAPGQTEISAAIDRPAPAGLVVVLPDVAGSSSLNLQALKNPSISGIAVQIHWSELEPAQGKPNWSKLDALFAAAEGSKKWVHLLVFPGFFTPAWALNGVETESFAIQYGPGHGQVEKLPAPWDTVYLNRWFAFLKLLSAKYGTSPAFRMIAADGPTSVSAEFTLPNSAEALHKWQKLSYRPSKYIGAWQKVFDFYAAEFPHQYVSLSAGAGQININERGQIQKGEQTSTKQGIVDAGMRTLGGRFVLQSSNVHAGPGPHSPNSEVEDRFVIDYSGRVITGLQMRGGAENASAVMGAKGDPPLALRKSIDLALEPNAAGRHINYLEIYESDVVAANMQPVLRYAAALFASGAPSEPSAHQ